MQEKTQWVLQTCEELWVVINIIVITFFIANVMEDIDSQLQVQNAKYRQNLLTKCLDQQL